MARFIDLFDTFPILFHFFAVDLVSCFFSKFVNEIYSNTARHCKQPDFNVKITVQRCINYSTVLFIIQCDTVIYTALYCKQITTVTVIFTVLYWRLCKCSTVNFTIIFLPCTLQFNAKYLYYGHMIYQSIINNFH